MLNRYRTLHILRDFKSHHWFKCYIDFANLGGGVALGCFLNKATRLVLTLIRNKLSPWGVARTEMNEGMWRKSEKKGKNHTKLFTLLKQCE